MNADDLEAELFKPSRVTVADGVLTINDTYPYEVELRRIASNDDLLAWVVHLTEKTWMTHDLMREFVYVAAHAAGLKLPKLP